MYYEITVEHNYTDAHDITKRVRDKFLTRCSLFAEAEYKGMDRFLSLNPDVISAKRSPIREFVNEKPEDGQPTIYDAVIADVFHNEDTGKDKLIKYHVGVYSTSVEEATTLVKEYMKQGLEDMKFLGIKETQIIDII